MKLTNIQIKDIASELDMGLDCFIHKANGTTKSLPNFDSEYVDEELWEETVNEIEKNRTDYIKLEKQSSRESFEVMERFASRMTRGKVRTQLLEALRRRGPFRQFRDVLNQNDEVLQKWYKYKEQAGIAYVRNCLMSKFDMEEPEATEEEMELENEIDFDNKTFHLVANSDKGEVTSDVSFDFEQDGNLVTADYQGGTISYGKIIAKLENNKLNMLYQCMTTEGELKAGKAMAEIRVDSDEKIRLLLDWEWIEGGVGKGQSEYLED